MQKKTSLRKPPSRKPNLKSAASVKRPMRQGRPVRKGRKNKSPSMIRRVFSVFTLRRVFVIFIFALTMALASSVYWLFSSGKVSRFMDKSIYQIEQGIKGVGFSLEHIVVDGRIRTSRDGLLKKLKLKKGDFIYGIDLSQKIEFLKKLPWVHSVRVERRLPNTLFIKLIERHPIAFFQEKNKHYLVDTYGDIIGLFPLKDYPGFLVASGVGAAKKLPDLIRKVGAFESVYAKATGAIFVSERRWDLILNNDLIIKLPENDLEEALKHIEELEKEERLSSRIIDTIDLRNKGKIYFYMSQKGKKRQKKQRGKVA